MDTTLVELSNNNSQLLELQIPVDRISLALDTLKFDRFKAWPMAIDQSFGYYISKWLFWRLFSLHLRRFFMSSALQGPVIGDQYQRKS